MTHSLKMTTQLQQGTLLDVLKKKMRQTKEEMEKYKDECEEFNRKFQLEAMRREEVRDIFFYFSGETTKEIMIMMSLIYGRHKS